MDAVGGEVDETGYDCGWEEKQLKVFERSAHLVLRRLPGSARAPRALIGASPMSHGA
jgi:hypothetical protein